MSLGLHQPLECNLCPSTFHKMSKLLKHQQTLHKFICSICNCGFTSRTMLNHHVRSTPGHESESEEEEQDHKQNQNQSQDKDETKHTVIVISDQDDGDDDDDDSESCEHQTYKCSFCDKHFLTLEDSQRHEDSHDNELTESGSDSDQEEQDQGTETGTETDEVGEMPTLKSQSQECPCPHCQLVFDDQAQLLSHISNCDSSPNVLPNQNPPSLNKITIQMRDKSKERKGRKRRRGMENKNNNGKKIIKRRESLRLRPSSSALKAKIIKNSRIRGIQILNENQDAVSRSITDSASTLYNFRKNKHISYNDSDSSAQGQKQEDLDRNHPRSISDSAISKNSSPSQTESQGQGRHNNSQAVSLSSETDNGTADAGAEEKESVGAGAGKSGTCSASFVDTVRKTRYGLRYSNGKFFSASKSSTSVSRFRLRGKLSAARLSLPSSRSRTSRSESEGESESNSEFRLELRSRAKSKPDLKSEMESKTVSVPQTRSESKPESQIERRTRSNLKLRSRPRVRFELRSRTKSKSESKLVLDSRTRLGMKSRTEPKTGSGSKLKSSSKSSSTLPTPPTEKTRKQILPFQCHYCMKMFNATYNLKIHLRIHTGEKPYVCPYENCGKAFSQSHSLAEHKRIHTGEKPFVCSVCNLPFRLASTLKAHVKIHFHNKATTNKRLINFQKIYSLSRRNKNEVETTSRNSSSKNVSSSNINKARETNNLVAKNLTANGSCSNSHFQIKLPKTVQVRLEDIRKSARFPATETFQVQTRSRPEIAVKAGGSVNKITMTPNQLQAKARDSVLMAKTNSARPTIAISNSMKCVKKERPMVKEIDSLHPHPQQFQNNLMSMSNFKKLELPSCVLQVLDGNQMLRYVCQLCPTGVFQYRLDAVAHAELFHGFVRSSSNSSLYVIN